MRHLIGSILLTFFFANMATAQIKATKYILQYNCETNYYDVKLKITEGNATSVLQRAQFNSQMTIKVPTGMTLEIMERHLPLLSNQTYQGSVPNDWWMSQPVIAPLGNDNYDFYTISPTLSPASFYNDVTEGDAIHIFSFKAGNEKVYDSRIQFFDNEIDPTLSDYEGGDLRNGFSIGGAFNSYDGNIHKSCTTLTKDEYETEFKIFPNPASGKIFIETPVDTKSIKMIDTSGRKIKEIKNPKSGISSLNLEQIKSGIYIIQLEYGDNHTSQFVSVL